MPILEDVEYMPWATWLSRSGKKDAPELPRARKPHTVRFKDDGLIPNQPRWPFVIYRNAVYLGDGHDPAAVMEDLFKANGWSDRWRDGIYDYVHYHSRIHEVLGIPRGKGRARFVGKNGRTFTLKAGDVVILPARTYDECTKVEDRPGALKTIPKVPVPRKDPVYGKSGPLAKLWKKQK